MQPQTFVFFGIVGSGKGTQVGLLQDFLKKDGKECVYIGTGEIFRKIADSSEDNEDTKLVKEILNSGRLMSDSETNNLVSNVVKSQFSPMKHLVFDGYPRTVPQAEFFTNLMESLGVNNVKIIYIKLSEEEAMKRNLLRGRSDDTEQGLARRFAEYREKVVPAIDYFNGREGYETLTIEGEQSVEDVHKDIINKLGYQ